MFRSDRRGSPAFDVARRTGARAPGHGRFDGPLTRVGALAVAPIVATLVVGAAVIMLISTRHRVTTPTERAVHSTLHTASLAAVSLRGAHRSSARRAPHLGMLTAADAVAPTTTPAGGWPTTRSATRSGTPTCCGMPTPRPWAALTDQRHRVLEAIRAASRHRFGHWSRSRCSSAPTTTRPSAGCWWWPPPDGPGRHARAIAEVARYVQPAGAGRPSTPPWPPRPRRGAARLAGADQSAFHLQRAQHDRLVRAHRPGAGA